MASLYEEHDYDRIGRVEPRSILAFMRDLARAISEFRRRGGITSDFSKNRG